MSARPAPPSASRPDRAALDVLARTIQVEAAFGPARGFDAVGAVIVNRAKRAHAPSLEDACRTFACWMPRADGAVPALAAAKSGRSYEHARRVARQILRGRHVDPTAGAVEWADIEEGPPPRGCLRVRIGGRWYFDPQTERRRK
ncbi:MAG: hypothetical protein ACKOEE_09510 [Tagaea sp.]